jgi:hypothetical protein
MTILDNVQTNCLFVIVFISHDCDNVTIDIIWTKMLE